MCFLMSIYYCLLDTIKITVTNNNENKYTNNIFLKMDFNTLTSIYNIYMIIISNFIILVMCVTVYAKY